jgi:hypothetical protein
VIVRVCVFVCVCCVCVHVCVLRVCLCMLCVCLCMNTCVRVCVCCVCVHCVFLSVLRGRDMRALYGSTAVWGGVYYTQTHRPTHTHTQIHTHVYIHTYVCVWQVLTALGEIGGQHMAVHELSPDLLKTIKSLQKSSDARVASLARALLARWRKGGRGREWGAGGGGTSCAHTHTYTHKYSGVCHTVSPNASP